MTVDADAVVTAEDAMRVDAAVTEVAAHHPTERGKKKSKDSNWISYRHVENCPLELRLRLERAANRRFYLIDHPELPDETTATVDYGTASINFGILGSTGNAYNVALQVPSPTCTCPDHCQNRHFCKHILFVLLKVVGLNVADHPNLLSLPTGASTGTSTSTTPIDPNHHDTNVNYAYTPTDLQTVLAMLRERRRAAAAATAGVCRRKQLGYRMANRLVRAAVSADVAAAQAAASTTAAEAEAAAVAAMAAGADESVTGATEEESKGVKRRRWQKDPSTTDAADSTTATSSSIDCPICFEDLTDAREDDVTYCRSTCGANFHKECIGHWLQSQSAATVMDQSETKAYLYCPNCRQEWWDDATLVNDTDERPAKRGRHDEHDRDNVNYNNYLNLAVQQGLPRKKRKRKNRGRRHNN